MSGLSKFWKNHFHRFTPSLLTHLEALVNSENETEINDSLNTFPSYSTTSIKLMKTEENKAGIIKCFQQE